MRQKNDTADVRLAELAAVQHGAVSFRQLRSLGFDEGGVARRAASGRLHRVHRGDYAVGHRGLAQHGVWMAAVLACGEGAVLSHGSAAALWGLLQPIAGPVDVSVPSGAGRRRREGIRVHRCRSLAKPPDPADAELGSLVTIRDGIPITSVPRTLEDLRGTVSPRLQRRAVRQAELVGYALGPAVRADRTRSDLERDFLSLCSTHDLPLPEVNVKIGPWTVDFLWPSSDLAVETDSYRYHQGSIAFEDDRTRDLALRRMGFVVHRYSEEQIRNHPAQVVADLREVLPRPHSQPS